MSVVRLGERVEPRFPLHRMGYTARLPALPVVMFHLHNDQRDRIFWASVAESLVAKCETMACSTEPHRPTLSR